MDRGQERKPGRRGGEQEANEDWYRLGVLVEPVATTESDVIDVPADSSSSATLPEPVDTSSSTQPSAPPEAGTPSERPTSRGSCHGCRTLEMDFKIKDRSKPQSVTITLRLEPDPSRSETAMDKDTSHYPRHRSLSMALMEDSEATTFSGTFPIDPFDDIPPSKRNIGLEKRKAAEPVRQRDKTTKIEEGIPEDDEEQQTHKEESKEAEPVGQTDKTTKIEEEKPTKVDEGIPEDDEKQQTQKEESKEAEPVGQTDKTTKIEQGKTTKIDKGIPEDDEKQKTQKEKVKDSALPSAQDGSDPQGFFPRLADLVRITIHKNPPADTGSIAEETPVRKDQAVSMHGIWPRVSSEVQVGASLYRLRSIPAFTRKKKQPQGEVPKDAVEGPRTLRKDVKSVKDSSLTDGLKTVSWAREEPGSFSDATACLPDRHDPHRNSEDSYVSVASSAENIETVQGITTKCVKSQESKNAVSQTHDHVNEKKSFRMLSVSQEYPNVKKYAPSAPPPSHEKLRKEVSSSDDNSGYDGSVESCSQMLDIGNSRRRMSDDSSDSSESDKSDANVPQESPDNKKLAANLTRERLHTGSRSTLDTETDPLVGSLFEELEPKHSHAARSTRSEEEEIEMDTDDLTSRGIQSTASSAVSAADTSSTPSDQTLPLEKSSYLGESEVVDIQPNGSTSAPSSISGEELSVNTVEDSVATLIITDIETDVTKAEVRDQDPRRKNDISPESHILKQSEPASQSSAPTKDHVSQSKLKHETKIKSQGIPLLAPNAAVPLTRSLSDKAQVDNEEAHLVPSGKGRTGGLPVTTVFSVPAVLSNLTSIRSNTRTDFEKKRFVDDAPFIHKTSTLKDIDGTDSNILSFESAASSGRNLSCQRLNTTSDAVPPSLESVLPMNIVETLEKSTSEGEERVQPEVNEVITVPGVVIAADAVTAIYQERLKPETLDSVQDPKDPVLNKSSEKIILEPTTDTLGCQNVEVEKISSEVELLQDPPDLSDTGSYTALSVGSDTSIESFDGQGFIPATNDYSRSPQGNNVSVTHESCMTQGPVSYIDELFDFFLSEAGNMIKVKMPPALSGSEIKKYLSQPQKKDTQEVSPITKAQQHVTKMMPELEPKDYRKVAFVPKPFVVQIPSASQSGKDDGKRQLPFIADTLRSPIVVMHTSTSSSQNVFQDNSDRGTESAGEVVNVPEGRDNDRTQAQASAQSPESETVPYNIEEVTAYATITRQAVSFKTENPPESLLRRESESGKTSEDQDSTAESSISSRGSVGVVRSIPSTLDSIYRLRCDSDSSTDDEKSDLNDPQIVGSAADISQQQQVEAGKLPDDCKESFGLPEKDTTQLPSQDGAQQEDIPPESVAGTELQEDQPMMSRTEGLTNPTSVEEITGNDRSVFSGEDQHLEEQSLLSNIPSLPNVDLQTEETLQNTPSSDETQTVPIGEKNPGESAEIPPQADAATECAVSVQHVTPVESVSEPASDTAPTPNNSLQSIPESAFQSLTSDLTYGSSTSAPDIDEFDEKELMKKAPWVHDEVSAGTEEAQHPPQSLVSHTEQERSGFDGEDTTFYTPRSMLTNLPSSNDIGEREKASQLREDDVSASSDKKIDPDTNATAALQTQGVITSKSDAGPVGNKDRAQEQTRSAEKHVDRPFPTERPDMPFKVDSLVVSRFRTTSEASENDESGQGRGPSIWGRLRAISSQYLHQGRSDHNQARSAERLGDSQVGQHTDNVVVTRGVEESRVEDQRRGRDAEAEQISATDAGGTGSDRPTVEVQIRASSEANVNNPPTEQYWQSNVRRMPSTQEWPTVLPRRLVSEDIYETVVEEQSPSPEDTYENVVEEQLASKARKKDEVDPERDERTQGAHGTSTEDGGTSAVEAATKVEREETEVRGSTEDEFATPAAEQVPENDGGSVVIEDLTEDGFATPIVEGAITAEREKTKVRGPTEEDFATPAAEQDFATPAAEQVPEHDGGTAVIKDLPEDGFATPAVETTAEKETEVRGPTEEDLATPSVEQVPEYDGGTVVIEDLTEEEFATLPLVECTGHDEPTTPAVETTAAREETEVRGPTEHDFATLPLVECTGHDELTTPAVETTAAREETEVRGATEDKIATLPLVECTGHDEPTTPAVETTAEREETDVRGPTEEDLATPSVEEYDGGTVVIEDLTADDVATLPLVECTGHDEPTTPAVETTAEREETKVRGATEDKIATPVVEPPGQATTPAVAEATTAERGETEVRGPTEDKIAAPPPEQATGHDGRTVVGASTEGEFAPPAVAQTAKQDRGAVDDESSSDDDFTAQLIKALKEAAEEDRSAEVSDECRESDMTDDQASPDTEEPAKEKLEDRVSAAPDEQKALKDSDEGVDQQRGAEDVSGEQESPPSEDDFELRTILINLARIFGPSIDESLLELVSFIKEIWNSRPPDTHPPGKGKKL